MTKNEWQKQRRAYRAYLRACAERRKAVEYADSPSHAAIHDPRPTPVERPVGYDVPYDNRVQYGWKSWNAGRIGRLIRRHQDRLGITPVRISEFTIDETLRRKFVRRLCQAVAEAQLLQRNFNSPRLAPGWTHIHKLKRAA